MDVDAQAFLDRGDWQTICALSVGTIIGGSGLLLMREEAKFPYALGLVMALGSGYVITRELVEAVT